MQLSDFAFFSISFLSLFHQISLSVVVSLITLTLLALTDAPKEIWWLLLKIGYCSHGKHFTWIPFYSDWSIVSFWRLSIICLSWLLLSNYFSNLMFLLADFLMERLLLSSSKSNSMLLDDLASLLFRLTPIIGLYNSLW